MDTDRTAAEFGTVEYDVVSDRFDLFDIVVVERFGLGERVVQRFDATLFDFEHRKVHDPDEFVNVVGNDIHQLRQIETEASHIIEYGFFLARAEEDHIARLEFAALNDRL